MKAIGKDYKVLVTGHSLGAALSTVFGFFASCDERFTRNSYLKMITFGSPYVGGRAFADAFKYQEHHNKIRYARFYNVRDSITYLPPNMKVSKSGSTFQHVGVSIRLPIVCCTCLPSKKKLFQYTREEGFLKSYYRAIKNNFLLNLDLPWKITNAHTLDELQDRLLYWGEVDPEFSATVNCSIDEIYDKVVFKKEKKEN